jgi:hypothetical protein
MFKNRDSLSKGSAAVLDTKTLLNDHIRKHVKAIRNSSPRTEKPSSKSLSKTATTTTANYNTTTATTINKRDSAKFPSHKRPISSIEMPSKTSDISGTSDKENHLPFATVPSKASHTNLVKQVSENVYSLSSYNTTQSRYSKLSAISSTNTSGDIGEETQTNHVNETKTFKEKLALNLFYPTALHMTPSCNILPTNN